MDERKVSVIGGDERYRWAAEELCSCGFSVEVFGVPELENTAENLMEAFKGAALALLPMAPLLDGKLSVAGDTVDAIMLPELMEPGGILVAGRLPENLEAWLSGQGLICFEYLEQERYLLQNAWVTAEGALGLLVGEMDRTIRGSRILITGWGRIGKYLAEMLREMGAAVTVAVRRENQKNKLEVLGYQTERIGEYQGKYHAVVNTIPAAVFDEKQLHNMMEAGCVLLELASMPGGFPAGFPVTDGRGLPGKTAPRTAGQQIAELVVAFYDGEGRHLE